MMEVLVTRAEATRMGLKRYFTGRVCKNGHIAERAVSNATCMRCGDQGHARRSIATRQKDSERKRLWYLARRDQELEKRRRNYQENIEARKAANAEYRATRKAIQAARRRSHYEANKARYIANVRARDLMIRRAMPKWADKELISAIYKLAADLTRIAGVDYHVDHFFPLQGEAVCGLHVHNNLRVITAVANIAKGNRLVEEGCAF